MVYNNNKVVKYPTKWVKVVIFHLTFHTVWKTSVKKCVKKVQNPTVITEYCGIPTNRSAKTMWKGGEELGRKHFNGYL